LQVWHIKDEDVSRLHDLESPGHRSDIRTVALSSDDSLLLSGSNNEVKIWNPRSGVCLRTIEAGYGLCALFAPGNRHAVVGTKEGNLDVLDVGASSRLQSVNAHAGAVWSLAALPDNRFVSARGQMQIVVLFSSTTRTCLPLLVLVCYLHLSSTCRRAAAGLLSVYITNLAQQT